MKIIFTSDNIIMKQQFEKKLLELEEEKKTLQVYSFCSNLVHTIIVLAYVLSDIFLLFSLDNGMHIFSGRTG